MTARDLTMGDLRDGDFMVDPKGVQWKVSDVVQGQRTVVFTVRHQAKQHTLDRPSATPAKIVRDWGPDPVHEAAVEAARAVGVVESDITAVQLAELDVANPAHPASQPAFEDMTDLEQRTHYTWAHGIWPLDNVSRRQRIADHLEAHRAQEAGEVNAKYRPHIHQEKK